MGTTHEGEILLKEKFGSTNEERLYVSPTDQNTVVVVNIADKNDIHSWITKIFLPQGFPNTVSKDYLAYQTWDTAQAFCSTITDVEDQHTDNDNDSEAWLQKKNREHFPTHCTSSEPEHHARTIKRKAEENIEDIKRKIYLAELENTTAKAALERKLMLEKHEVELEILKLKKEIVSKQLEDAKCR